jgi:hypothetical protein
MTFGLSIEAFTVLHVAISMIAIFAGFVVVGGLFSNAPLPGWTAFFLVMAVLTSLTGFLFPFRTVTPAIITGMIATPVLLAALWALYRHRLAGRWRAVYVVGAIASLYLNVFVFIAQSFQKVSFLQPLARTGSEPPFAIAQGVTLVAFLFLGWVAVKRFHPARPVV